MPFARPTLAELITRVRGDLRGRLEILGPLLRRAMVDVLGVVWAGGIHTLYGFLDWLSLQLFATTAEREALLKKAAMYGITPVPATFATGVFTATGTNGSIIPINTILRLDADIAYRTTAGVTIGVGGNAPVPIIAVLAGDASNLPAATTLTFESPIVGVDATGLTSEVEGGNDEEGTEDLRARFLEHLRRPPMGGADHDYVAWAKLVAGVTRAWTYPNELGLGTVVVRFVRDGDVSIFPDAGEVAAVQAKLDAERPITAVPIAVAPTELAVAFTIAIEPDNGDTRAAVQAELVDLFRREAAPGNAAGTLGKVLVSKIRTAIGTAAGVEDYTLTVPATDVVPALGELARVGVITWA